MNAKAIGLSLLATLLVAVSAQGGLVDLTKPGDPVVGFNAAGTGADWPGNESPPNTIDNNTGTKYLNFGTTGSGGGSGTGGVTGLTVTPKGPLGVVTGMSFTTANDAADRDPMTFILEGQQVPGGAWTQIATGATNVSTTRFATSAVSFPNDQYFVGYRVSFPDIRNAAAANSMQIGEIELLADQLSLLSDVTRPGDMVTGFNAAGPGASWPANENPANAIDNNTGTKYLNFGTTGNGGGSGTGGPTGLVVTPSYLDPTLVNGLSLTSANDWSQRDPASYELYGSNDGINFELIASGAVPAFSGRFTGQVFAFDNDVPYYQYALSFPTIVDPSTANSMQIAEIQLLGQTVPEPLTLTLSALAAGALGGYIRRRRR